MRWIRIALISNKVTIYVSAAASWPRLFKRWIALSTGSITIQRISIGEINYVIRWIVIYPVDSAIQLLNNQGLMGLSYLWNSCVIIVTFFILCLCLTSVCATVRLRWGHRYFGYPVCASLLVAPVSPLHWVSCACVAKLGDLCACVLVCFVV